MIAEFEYHEGRKKGFVGDWNAAMISWRAFRQIARDTRPIHLQFVVAVMVAAMLLARHLTWGGIGFDGVMFAIIVHGIGLVAETINSIREDQIRAYAAHKNGDPRISDDEIGRLLDRSSGIVAPAFCLALIVDLAVLVHG